MSEEITNCKCNLLDADRVTCLFKNSSEFPEKFPGFVSSEVKAETPLAKVFLIECFV